MYSPLRLLCRSPTVLTVEERVVIEKGRNTKSYHRTTLGLKTGTNEGNECIKSKTRQRGKTLSKQGDDIQRSVKK